MWNKQTKKQGNVNKGLSLNPALSAEVMVYMYFLVGVSISGFVFW